MTREQARKIVEKIVKDLNDRRGLSGEWDQIDDDIQEEIKRTWADIVMKEANKAVLP